jgi:uncharacterized delta-60 repeat protein
MREGFSGRHARRLRGGKPLRILALIGAVALLVTCAPAGSGLPRPVPAFARAGMPRSTAAGQDGTLDPNFGSNGVVTTDFNNHSADVAAALAVQANGKIVVAGTTQSSTSAIAIARYLPGGQLDTTLNSSGTLSTNPFGSDQLTVTSLLLIPNQAQPQQDDAILVAGSDDTTGQAFVAEYTAGAALMTSFNPTGAIPGTLRKNFSGSAQDDSIINALALQPDMKIVLTGVTNSSPFVARIGADGLPDTGFGSGGITTFDYVTGGNANPTQDTANAIALESTGEIVVAGTYANPNGSASDFGLARFSAAGALDSTTTTSFTSPDNAGANAVTVDAGSKIIAAGFSSDANGDGDFALARYTPAGALDTTFGTGGKVITPFSAASSQAFAVTVLANGQIAATGAANDGFATGRYSSDGALDPTFGTDSRVVTTFSSSAAYARAVAEGGNGVYVAGSSVSGAGDEDFTVVHYSNASQSTATPTSTPTASPTSSATDTATSTATATPSGKAHTTVLLTSSANPSYVAQRITFTARVSATTGAYIPGGTVTFKDGSHVLPNGAGIALDSSGRATYSTSSLAPGKHGIRVFYNGTPFFYNGPSHVLTQVVRLHATIVAATSTPAAPTRSQVVTFSVAVTTKDGSGTPTGAVVFKDGPHQLGGAKLDDNGRASLKAGPFLPGRHGITIVYKGSATDSPSTATAILVIH